MDTSNIKLGIGSYIIIILLIIVFGLIFMKSYVYNTVIEFTGDTQIQESQLATKETTELLLSLDKLKLDTNVLQSTYLQSLNTFPNFPIDSQTLSNFGKQNPFIGNFIIVNDKATTTVGAVVYSNQRSTNNGNSIAPVSPNRVNSTRGR